MQQKGNKSKAKLRLVGASRHIKFGFLRKYVLKVLVNGDYKSLGDFARSRNADLLNALHGPLQL